ncbi:hypothetical protein [Actinotalea sp. K2]|uniref:hypothetical protein n=1 Tax=Actinotalea sp. K2 TaxID=2939438 RepID=UPI002017152C|nr:hypothetical protein [Actinotalea sp. K2]MCL3859925.1 hypothetical protein [Actinotalea sp. K2]
MLTPLRRALPHRDDRDRGVGTLEYVGIVAVAALLVAALVLGVTATRYQEHLQVALCEIISLGQGDCGAVAAQDRAPEDYIPDTPCVVGSQGNDSNEKVTVVVTLESGERWAIDELGDGTYRLTRATDGSLGIGVGVGFDLSATIDSERFGAGAYANVSAAVAAGQGESYIATSPEQARHILGAKRQDEVKDLWFGDDNIVRDGADWLNEALGGSNDNERREPDEWFVEGGIELAGTAGVTAITGSADATATVDAYLGRTERRDGTSTDYLRAEMAINGGLTGWGADPDGTASYVQVTAEGAAGAVIEIDRDANGNPTTFRMTSILMGNATGEQSSSGASGISDAPEYTEQTLSFPLQTAADRELATRIMHGAGVPYYPGVTEGVDVARIATDRLSPTSLSRDLFASASERGHITTESYSLATGENSFNAMGKVGVELGLAGSSIDTTRTATGSQYWNGRAMVDRAGCF